MNKPFTNAVIYFLTGTGNSLRVARMLADECLKNNIPSALIPVDTAVPETDITLPEETLTAFVFPTHGFMPPWSGIKFLFKMPVKKGYRFLCVPTRGSFHIWKVPIPGAAGLASVIPPSGAFIQKVQAAEHSFFMDYIDESVQTLFCSWINCERVITKN